ncbi:MAG: precorrin-6y C5,15-methyltransferase (decarboxylating) subunit CbiE [Cellvibrionaceae bacterium]|nr:precorrin-6y C5,15-methyltransferase (decarboxylating) subunit CbiE [Cellvibrionaceae bacterium]
MLDKPIHVIGLGVAETAELSLPAKRALQHAELVIGAQRQLAIVDSLLAPGQRCIVLPKLAQLKALLQHHANQSIAVLASGDPLYYGIGAWLAKQFQAQRLQFYPAVSSLQVACHRLGLALQNVTVVSLHGRPLLSIRRYLKRRARLLVLTDQHSQPQHLAGECCAANFAESTLTVCEKLGYASEKISRFGAAALLRGTHNFDALHVTYIDVLGEGGIQPECPGIPDEHFATGEEPGKGMISKREVRLAILSFMQVAKNDVVWDIGAGCGGVAVELALWQPQATIYAIEYHKQRLNYLQQNREHFGVVENLQLIEGRAPQALSELPAANKVFIGGSDGELPVLLNWVWQMLPLHGVMVVSSVVHRSRQQLHQFASTLQPNQLECLSLSVQRGLLSHAEICYTAKRPVDIFKFTKFKNRQVGSEL